MIQEIYNEFIKSLRVKKIFVFGTGEYANNMKLEKIEVYSYVDNNAEKWGKFFKDRPIISPIELNQYINEDVFIIIASTFFLEIAEQLSDMGFYSKDNFAYFEDIKSEEAYNIYRNLLMYKDIHKGKRAFLIGNGPSLKVEDLDKLQNEITFAANKIYLAYEQTEWRPTYYVAVDNIFVENFSKQVDELEGEKFLIENEKRYFNNYNQVTWLDYLPMDNWGELSCLPFSKDISLTKKTFGGYTVIYTMLELAYHMGIQEVYILGLDFSYNISNSNFKSTFIICDGNEKNHFHPNYHLAGDIHNIPRLDMQYKAFSVAKKVYEEDSRKIFNASRKTKLDVFSLVNFDEIL